MSLMHVDLGSVGRWTDETVFVVDADRIRAYAAATDDDLQHQDAEVAPPLFAVVAIGGHIDAAVGFLIADEDRRWGVHAEQDMYFHGRIRQGASVRTRAAIVGVQPRASGTTVIIKTETRSAAPAFSSGRAAGTEPDLLNEAYVTLFLRRKSDAEPRGTDPPDHRTPAEVRMAAKAQGQVAQVSQTLARDQTYRYAEASGDHNPIHLDEAFARSVGLPGIIVHGMCTMAFAARAVLGAVGGSDPDRLRRLAVRFARPVLPGQTITTSIWQTGLSDDAAVVAFETHNPEGKAVLLDGLAELAR